MKYIIALQNVLCCLTKSMRNILPFSILAFYHLIRRVTFKKNLKMFFSFFSFIPELQLLRPSYQTIIKLMRKLIQGDGVTCYLSFLFYVHVYL